MKPFKHYYCEHPPTDDEIKQALHIVHYEHCVLFLHWFVKFNGFYKVFIDENTTFDEVKSRLPKFYGM